MTLNHYVGSNPTGLSWYDHFNILIYSLHAYLQTNSNIRKVKIIHAGLLIGHATYDKLSI